MRYRQLSEHIEKLYFPRSLHPVWFLDSSLRLMTTVFQSFHFQWEYYCRYAFVQKKSHRFRNPEEN